MVSRYCCVPVQIGLRVEPELVDADQISAEDADDVGDEHQDRQSDQPGDEPRQHEIAQRVGGQRRQRVDLIGHAHRPDLRRHRRSDATGDHQSGDHRTKLPGNRQHDNRRHRSSAADRLNPVCDCECQHHAGEDCSQPDHRQREIADIDHFAEKHAKVKRRRKSRGEGPPGEHHEPSGCGEKARNTAPIAARNVSIDVTRRDRP